MKKTILMISAILMFIACGSGGGGNTEPPIVSGGIDFLCLDVDNDQTCEAELEASGVFYSGPVHISGSPMPTDYLNVEIRNALDTSASIFVAGDIEIVGCTVQPVAFEAVTIEPDETAEFSSALWGYRCGSMASNETTVTLYNAAHFNPSDYASPLLYPRDQELINAVVRWQNTGAGE